MKTKEKRNKTATVRARISDEKMEALRAYCLYNDVKITEVIDNFLSELLKDRLKK